MTSRKVRFGVGLIASVNGELEQLDPQKKERRIFISYHQVDVSYAQRIAVIATEESYGYWLDVVTSAFAPGIWQLEPVRV